VNVADAVVIDVVSDGEALKSGNFRRQERMMDALMTALERNMVGFKYVTSIPLTLQIIADFLSCAVHSLWNYNPSNTDEVGDDWNYENFSWFSQSKLDPRLRTGAKGAELDQGCRLMRQVVVSALLTNS
jgi:hypothetical protein